MPLTYQGFLAELLLAECDDRARRRSIRRVKAAGFPREKWLGDFEFDANPNINPATIHSLCAAIVDRLTFGGHIIETGTDSYRLAHTLAHRTTA